MVTSLLKKTEFLKTTQKKQLKYLITTIQLPYHIAETTSGKRPSSISNPNSQGQDRATLKKVIVILQERSKCCNHKRKCLTGSLSFDLPSASKEDRIKISNNSNRA